MTFSNIPQDLTYDIQDDKVKFQINGISTNWMNKNDSFIERIDKDNLNQKFLLKHLIKEIEIKNILDEGLNYLNHEKYFKAIEDFDEVLFYDPDHPQALINKSFALRGQKHFVKALRYYKRAVKSSDAVKDIEYHKNLLKEANSERDNFPKLKLNIYAGDEFFAKGEFEKAVESYDKALVNPSKFKEKILYKLLNKKATALLKLNEYEKALDAFTKSLNVDANDYAYFGQGISQFKLGIEVNEKFKGLLNINKKQMLKQAKVLNELGLYEQSLAVTDFLIENHLKVDDFYMELLNVGKISLSKLHRN